VDTKGAMFMVSKMAKDQLEKKKSRKRRTFTPEFKGGAVGLVLDQHQTVSQVCRDLDLATSVLCEWLEKARADRSDGATGLTTQEREELRELRKRVRVLEEERTILKKGLAFFAKESK
jgi:transposase